MSNYKRGFLAHRNIDMQELDRHFIGVDHRATIVRDKHIKRSQKIKDHNNALAALAKQGEDGGFDIDPAVAAEVADLVASSSEFIEGLLVGAIEGLTRPYNRKCSSSLIASIDTFFKLIANLQFWNPSKFAKFQLSQVKFMDDTNQVYARCHYTDFSRSFAGFFDFDDVEELIPKASRSFGIFMSEGPALVECANYGYSTSNGYDCGSCGSKLVALIFDANL